MERIKFQLPTVKRTQKMYKQYEIEEFQLPTVKRTSSGGC